jgi:hypothetical protein
MQDDPHEIHPDPSAVAGLLEFFLVKGFLPPNSTSMSKYEFYFLLENLISDKESYIHLKPIWSLLEDQDVRSRFAWQLPSSFLKKLVTIIDDLELHHVEEIVNDSLTIYAVAASGHHISDFVILSNEALVATIARPIEQRWDEVYANYFLEAMLHAHPYLLHEMEKRGTRVSSSAFVPVIEKLRSRLPSVSHPVRDIHSKLAEARERSRVTFSETLMVNNAGLVLLTPFIYQLFDHLGLVEGFKLSNPAKAVCLLYYMQSAGEDPAEFEVLLPKLLCNIEVSKPTATNHSLTARERHACDHLLQHVAQKSSVGVTIDQIRAVFHAKAEVTIQSRESAISIEKHHWKAMSLIVPLTDTMLLPWMRRPLRVRLTSS